MCLRYPLLPTIGDMHSGILCDYIESIRCGDPIPVAHASLCAPPVYTCPNPKALRPIKMLHLSRVQAVHTRKAATRRQKADGFVAQATVGSGGSGGCHNGPPPAKPTDSHNPMRPDGSKASSGNRMSRACPILYSIVLNWYDVTSLTSLCRVFSQ